MNFRKIVKSFIPKGLFHYIEPYGHLVEAIILNIIYGFPARDMKVIAVTGTNGKTTTTYMIHKMLSQAGYKTGLMTTVAFGVGENIKPQIQHMTNVPVPELMKRLKYMRSERIDWLVFEVTSQGLAQNRVWGVPFSVVVLTNITHEHLDYHRTFENYREAKKRLFTFANKNRRGLKVGIINADDPSCQIFVDAIANPVTYGIKEGALRATKVHLTPAGSRYMAKIRGDEYRINCHIPGSFNVSNSLAAVAVGRAVGLTKHQIEKGIDSMRAVEGRMTRIVEGQDFDVIVDFAHTPDSFEKLFKDLRPVVKGKLIVMFGSAGRRDEAKRAAQGKLAGEYCDEVVITEEDDRDIDGIEIMNQIAGGAEQVGKVRDKDLFLVHNRTEAIDFTLKRAKKGDTVILLGKGHEKTIERADGEHPWDESATTRDALRLIK
ncbi:MAG: UDP-N-acetylmuramyl-tripeptide synthetase [Candidatus Saccharimonadales bacterium]